MVFRKGRATCSQFRTAPLLGIGKRIISLHDGRTIDLLQAILAHGGEATQVIANFNGLSSGQKQNILDFLRGCRREKGVANNDAFTL